MSLEMKKIVLASNNKGKVREFSQLLDGKNIEVLPQSTFNIADVDETGLTFVENAILKARNACAISGLPAIADDSGLEVDALQGAPGIYSARYAGINASDADNNTKLLDALKEIDFDKCTARFQCLMVYMEHENDPTPIICQGSWEGKILKVAQGENGFGYDSLFFIEEKNCSSAELPAEIKNTMSHRGKALSQLIKHII